MSLLYTPSVDNSYTPQAVGAAAIPSAGLVTMVRVCTRLAPGAGAAAVLRAAAAHTPASEWLPAEERAWAGKSTVG